MHLAYIDGPSGVTVTTLATRARRTHHLPGYVEYLRFQPGTLQILVGLAQADADRSGADGSGCYSATPTTRPYTEGPDTNGGWRHAWVLNAADDGISRISAANHSVWEADWCRRGVVAIASDVPGESAWYRARIVTFPSPDEPPVEVATSSSQLGLLTSSTDGQRIAYVEAICSDRGVIAGNARLLDLDTGEITTVHTGGVDITSLSWRDDSTLLAAGQRRMETVIGEIDVSGTWQETWSSRHRTAGTWYPSAAPFPSGKGSFVAAMHGYGEPPTLVVVTPSGETTLVTTAHAGTKYLRKVGGTATVASWKAPDGLEIEGVLVTPDGQGPHPLIVLIHGGPVAAYRPSWHMIYNWTPLFASQGYAVLHANPRGSGGRGQAFAAHVLGDMGGADTQDFISGIDALAARGFVDPARVAVAGRSYGGYMSSWLVTQDNRIAAAIPMAPVTNWFSQHFTSNIPDFDEAFLGASVTDPTGNFFTRSPVFFADRVTTPVLNITGGNDRCTPPTQAIEFHHALTQHGAPSSLVVYPTEGHHIETPAAHTDLLTRMLDFLHAQMPPVTTI
ncbi:prolyl oligopeptidase family serine peptidase [Streptomyces sp. CLV115]|uniref:alpha/beta hydrolase family protein n=1 Tax=Streptomyces sp. CLV115 TaxID=3138502 RepID=UPI00313DEE28